MSNKDNKIQVSEILETLEQFCGTEQIHTSISLKYNYTDGVNYLATTCNAFWLLTDINAVVTTILKHHSFLTVELVKEKDTATVFYLDGDNNILFEQEYKYTDFTLHQIKFFYTNKVLMLPSEY